MEGTVTMPLNDYDALKDRIRRLESRIKELEEEIEGNIFEFKESYSKEALHLFFTEKAQKYIDKAFSKFSGSYLVKPREDLVVWDAAKKITSRE